MNNQHTTNYPHSQSDRPREAQAPSPAAPTADQVQNFTRPTPARRNFSDCFPWSREPDALKGKKNLRPGEGSDVGCSAAQWGMPLRPSGEGSSELRGTSFGPWLLRYEDACPGPLEPRFRGCQLFPTLRQSPRSIQPECIVDRSTHNSQVSRVAAIPPYDMRWRDVGKLALSQISDNCARHATVFCSAQPTCAQTAMSRQPPQAIVHHRSSGGVRPLPPKSCSPPPPHEARSAQACVARGAPFIVSVVTWEPSF